MSNLLERIEQGEFAVVVLDINDYKQEGMVTAHSVYTRKIIRLAKMGVEAEKALTKDCGFGVDCINYGLDDKCRLLECEWQDFCKLRKEGR